MMFDSYLFWLLLAVGVLFLSLLLRDRADERLKGDPPPTLTKRRRKLNVPPHSHSDGVGLNRPRPPGKAPWRPLV